MWSGGLGNPRKNTLPPCQLEFIYNSVRLCRQQPYYENFGWLEPSNKLGYSLRATSALDRFDHWVITRKHWLETRLLELLLSGTFKQSGSRYIWIDTLCIPTGEGIPNLKHLKQKAIDKMAYIYSAAQHVLVLDQNLEKVSYYDTTDTALAAQFATCPWMGRCWTFQEACLAREFSFLLKDRVINPRKWGFYSALNYPLDRSETFLDEVFKRDFLKPFDQMPDIINDSLSGRRQDDEFIFTEIWAQLAKRSTTKREDLHGIMAVTRGLSAQEILNSQDSVSRCVEERMLAILRSQKSLPLSMLYIPYSEDTQLCKDYAWVPLFPSGELMFFLGSMTWEPDGQGLAFIPSETSSVIFILESGKNYQGEEGFYIKVELQTGDRYPDTAYVFVQLCRSKQNVISPAGHGKRFCLVMDRYPSNVQGCGAMFLLEREASTEFHLSFLSSISHWLCLLPYPAASGEPFPEYGAYIAAQGTKCVLDCGKSIYLLQGISFL